MRPQDEGNRPKQMAKRQPSQEKGGKVEKKRWVEIGWSTYVEDVIG